MTIIIPHGFEPNYTLGFVKGLLANGVHICVISSDTDERRFMENGIRNINLRGSQDHKRTFTEKLINILKYYIRLLLILFRFRKNIVHFTGLFGNTLILIDGILLNLCIKLLSSRYIYTVHNVLPHSKENSPFFKWIYKLIYRIPDKLLVHTQLAKHRLMDQFGVSEERIHVISIGINEEVPVTGVSKQEARHRIGYKSEDRLILFFGKADEYKGLENLIEAFNMLNLPSTKLIISGWFPSSSYRHKILSAIDASFRRKDIHLYEGFTPNEEVENYFKSADVLVLPYKNIYQSGVVFLCFNFGLPIVATDVGSLSEFIDEDIGIITKTNGSEGVAEGIRRFFETQSRFRYDKIVEKTKKYKWDRICKQILTLYQLHAEEMEMH